MALLKVNTVNERPDANQPVDNYHWVVVQGLVTHQGTPYVVVNHSWSGGPVVWSYAEFLSVWQATGMEAVYVSP